jgi:hypothetical protein
VLSLPPPRPGAQQNSGHGPKITPELSGLVFAIRDAEVVFIHNVPQSCVLPHRHQVP